MDGILKKLGFASITGMARPVGMGAVAAVGGTGRDLRVDFFRGVALWWMFVNHSGGNWLRRITLSNFALCDAAEVFVLLAGVSAAIAYGRRLNRDGYAVAAPAVLRRAGTLYVVHLFMFVIVTAEIGWLAKVFHMPDILAWADLAVLRDAPYEAFGQILMLRFQPNFMDILPTYIALLLSFALVLPLLRRPLALLAGSVVLYFSARWFGWRPTFWLVGWSLNPFTWQLLFVTGAVFHAAPHLLPRPRRALDVLAGAALLFGFVTLHLPHLFSIVSGLPFPAATLQWEMLNDKIGLQPLRLLSIIALAWAVLRLVPPKAAWLRGRPAAPLVLMGQHSLPVFCSATLGALLAGSVLAQDSTWWMQIAVNVIGALALWSVARAAVWSRAQPASAK